MELKFGDYEIRPSEFLASRTEKGFITSNMPGRYDLVKWYNHEPMEVVDLKTGAKKIKTRSCYVIANLEWIKEKDPYFKFSSCGDRFLEACIKNHDDERPVEWERLCDWIMAVEKVLSYIMTSTEND